jgi:large subunit ribosomal protein L29
MALKPKDIRGMNAQDRAKALMETRSELMHQRGLAAMGGAVKNPGQIRDLRTSIARILTVQREDLLKAHAAKGTVAPRQPRAGQRPPLQVAKMVKAAKGKESKAPAKAPAKGAAKAPAKGAAKGKKTGGT